MLPISRVIPKELLPLGPRPALLWVGEELAQAGVERLVLVSSPSKSDIGRVFGDSPGPASPEGVSRNPVSLAWNSSQGRSVGIETVIQASPRGLGHAVLCGRDAVGDKPFLVALGDCVLGLGGRTTTVVEMIRLYEQSRADAVIAFQTVAEDQVSRYGIARVGKRFGTVSGSGSVFELDGLVEKPSPECAPSRFAVAGRYLFSPAIFPLLESTGFDAGGELQLTSAIQRLIDRGGKVLGIPLGAGEERFDLGNYRSWAESFVRFAVDHDPELLDRIGRSGGS